MDEENLLTLSKQEIDDWQDHQITREVQRQCKERIDMATDALIARAGYAPIEDAYMRGIITAYKAFLSFEFDYETPKEE